MPIYLLGVVIATHLHGEAVISALNTYSDLAVPLLILHYLYAVLSAHSLFFFRSDFTSTFWGPISDQLLLCKFLVTFRILGGPLGPGGREQNSPAEQPGGEIKYFPPTHQLNGE